MPKRDALIIATAQYSDPLFHQLMAPEADAATLADALSNPNIGGFRTQALIDRPSYEVAEAIEDFFVDRALDDLLLLYFTGHGIKDEDGRLYFATVNTKRNRLLATSVPASLVNDAMLRSRSRRQILILDCCHSGAFARGMIAKSDASVGTIEYFRGTGRVVLTASDATQYALEAEHITGSGVRSIFTEVLVKGLTSGEADTNSDGLISIDELFAYTEDQILLITPSQKPMKWALGTSGAMIVALNKNPVIRPAELPKNLVDALDKDNLPSIRQVAAKELGRMLSRPDRAVALAAELQLRELLEDDSRTIQEIAQGLLAEKAGREADESARQAAAEGAILEKEQQTKAAEQARLAEEEDQRQAAAERARLEKEQQTKAAEQARLAEEKHQRQAAAERARLKKEQQAKAAEKARLAEEERQRQAAAERARLEKEQQAKAAEKARLAEEERQRQAAVERARQEKEQQAKAAEQARLAEEKHQRQAAAERARLEKEQQAKAAEQARLADEEDQRQAATERARQEKEQQAKTAEQARLAEEEDQRQAATERARQEKEQQAKTAEQARLAEEEHQRQAAEERERQEKEQGVERQAQSAAEESRKHPRTRMSDLLFLLAIGAAVLIMFVRAC